MFLHVSPKFELHPDPQTFRGLDHLGIHRVRLPGSRGIPEWNQWTERTHKISMDHIQGTPVLIHLILVLSIQQLFNIFNEDQYGQIG